MKTQVLLFALMTVVFATQTQGQNRTIVNAQNSEISDNLDLRVVASVFGDSKNLEDFERRLNDPKLQISNLDLNYDGQVDYLRVIESIEKRTHIIIIQSVLNRDLYQDVATIEVEKNWNNNVRIQVVGNSYFYGDNYIYEPVYYYTPMIYANFWMSNYRPYFSNWCWNYYPSYYYAWNAYPVFRYRYNVNVCLNNYNYNRYNYVSYRRSNYSNNYYYSNRSNGYERQHPEYSFSRRNATVSNRHELDKIRNSRNYGTRNEIGYSTNRNEYSRTNTPQTNSNQRDYSYNRTESPKVNIPQSNSNQRDYSQNRTESPRVNVPQSNSNQRDYSQNRTESPRATASQRNESSQQNSPSRNSSSSDNSNSSRNNNRRT